jgi:hypothetical protein
MWMVLEPKWKNFKDEHKIKERITKINPNPHG